MATTPFPFFFSPPYASPSAPYPPPASGYFPAPAYGSYSFSSDATYHQPPPFFYSGPNALPYAAPYPYPPPAPAYGFSPLEQPPILASTPVPTKAEPNWPPPSPNPTTSTAYNLVGAPASGSSPYSHTPTTAVPPAPPIPPATSVFSPPPPAGRPATALLGCPLGAPLATDLSSLTPRLLDSIPTTPSRKRCKPQRRPSPTATDSTSTPQADLSSLTPCLFDTRARMEDRATLLEAAQERPRGEDAIHARRPQELLNSRQSRLDQQLTRDQTSFDTIQGEISRLSEAVSLLVTSVGRSETPISSAHLEHDTRSSLAATMKHPATTGSLGINEQSPANKICLFSTPPAAASNLSPIAEANTPWSGNVAIAANTQHPQGQPIHLGNLQVPTSMQDASSMLDEVPQPYSLHNVFLADGTERHYYALPEDYPLVRATPGPVFDVYDVDTNGCTDEFVDVFPSFSVQQSHEDTESLEESVSGQLINCFSKAPETKQISAYLNDIIDDLDYTFDQQQDDEKTSVNIQQLRPSQLNVLVIHERRNEWDPGIHTYLNLTPTIDIDGFLQTSILNGVLAARIQFGISKCFVPRQCNYRVPSRLMNPGIHFLWDPGILNQMDILPEETAVPNLLRSGQKKFKLLIFIGKHVGSKQFWAQLLLHCHSWCTTPSVFLRVQSCCLPIILDYLYSEPAKQLVCYCSIFSWTAASLSTIVHMRLVLSAGKIVQEGRDVWDPRAATFHVRFMTADDATKLQCIDVYKSAMIQILAVKLGARNAPIFATAIMCFELPLI